MNRPTRWKARLTLAIVTALAAAPVPVAAADSPAGDEYVLEIPGVRQTDTGPVADASATATGGSRVQRGVVGESDAAATPLAALGDAVATAPASILASIATLAAVLVVARRPRPSGRR